MARTRQQQGKQTVSDELTENRLPKRTGTAIAKTRLLGLYERFVQGHPDEADGLLERCRELTDRYRPPRVTRDLSIREAAERIGITAGYLRIKYNKGVIGATYKGRPVFSEQECDDFRLSRGNTTAPPDDPILSKGAVNSRLNQLTLLVEDFVRRHPEKAAELDRECARILRGS